MIYGEDIKKSLTILREGGLILYPTDTIWGIGCDATNPAAVDKIFGIKTRSENKSLIILVDSESMLSRYVKEVPPVAFELAEASFTPLTVILPGAKNLAVGIAGKDGSVGIRICKDEFCSELIGRFRKPIVSTSANISGEPAPSVFSEVSKAIIDAVDYCVRYRQDDRQKHKPSPVIQIELNGVLKIIRE